LCVNGTKKSLLILYLICVSMRACAFMCLCVCPCLRLCVQSVRYACVLTRTVNNSRQLQYIISACTHTHKLTSVVDTISNTSTPVAYNNNICVCVCVCGCVCVCVIYNIRYRRRSRVTSSRHQFTPLATNRGTR